MRSGANARTAAPDPAARRPGDAPLFEVRGLKKHYPLGSRAFGRDAGTVRAVDGVSFAIASGETLALVGESGCGKSTTGRLMLRLIEPSAGQLLFEGRDITHFSARQMRPLRRDLQMIFQDPYASLSPRLRIEETLAEPMEVHGLASSPGERRERVAELLRTVGLPPSYGRRYPHQFSGGQRQRIGIARALAVRPRLIVADEPVSALDVSIQSQIVNLMQDLQDMYGLAYLLIAHDLAVVKHIAHRVAVMYLGTIVELADKSALFEAPYHPYTQALLSAAPKPDPKRRRERIVLSGDVPSPSRIPSGCRFHTRCPIAQAVCREQVPALTDVGGRFVACHFAKPHPIPSRDERDLAAIK